MKNLKNKLTNLKNKKRKGFSLMELVIVMAIIGILALMIIPQLGQATKDAKVTTFTNNSKAIQSAIGMYQAGHKGKYPTTADQDELEKYLQGTLADLTSKPEGADYSGWAAADVNTPPELNFTFSIDGEDYKFTWNEGLVGPNP